MLSWYPEFLEYLEAGRRDKCIELALGRLETGDVGIATLYDEVLRASMDEDFCAGDTPDVCIWKEHVRTSIIRTVVECCYPYVIRERYKSGRHALGEVLVFCPPEEWHDLGARMAADFFTLAGFQTTYAGANTPRETILGAVRHIRPAYIAVSITSPFNLVAARKVTDMIKKLRDEFAFTLIVGGQACRDNTAVCCTMNADLVLDSSEDILRLGDR